MTAHKNGQNNLSLESRLCHEGKSEKEREVKFTTRQLVIMAVFGTIWGIVEISLGSVFHAIKLPLTGTIMAAFGLYIAITGRLFVPIRGSTLFVGAVAMVLKLFSLGSILLGPMVGILMEALIVELVLSFAKAPSRWVFVLAGSTGVLWTLLHPFFTGLLLFGREPIAMWLDLLDEGTQLLGISPNLAILIVLTLVAIRVVIGGVSGWLAWDTGHQIRARIEGSANEKQWPRRRGQNE